MSDDMQDAFDKLSTRGTPRGFDHVLAGAAASAAAESGADEGNAAVGDLDPIPFVSAEPVARPRRPYRSMITAAGVASLLLVSLLAVSAVVGSGGSNTPEGAVRRLADALSHEDPLAAADVLAPDEVRSLHATLDAAAHKAAELQLVQTAGAPLAGVDFNVSGLDLSTQSLGDGYVKVTVDGGTFTAATKKTKFSALMQKALRNTEDNTAESDLAKLAASENLPTFVVVVQRDGKWYVSAAYTALEYVRAANELPAADFGSGEKNIATLGADSPDAAVQDAMRALQRNDWTKLMSMVSPTEVPFYDYRDAFTELARKSNDGEGAHTNFTIDSMTTNSDVKGDTARVTLNAAGTTDSGTWSIKGGCFTPPETEIAISCEGESRYFSIIPTLLTGMNQASQITVVQQDGRWFVSPVGTVLDQLDHLLGTIDRRSLFSLIGLANQLQPDGALTLGKPFELNAANQHLQILSFDGHRGQKLLGLAKSTAKSTSLREGGFSSYGTSVRIYAPDGTELNDTYGVLDGESAVLPADGKYTFVVQTFGQGVKVTFWNEGDAPAEAKQSGGISDCTYTGSSAACLSGPGETNGQLGVNPVTAWAEPLCDGTDHIDANGHVISADGQIQRDAGGVIVTVPPGFDLAGMCADYKQILGNGDATATTFAVGPAVTAVSPTTNG